MIHLHQYPAAYGLPSLSPFCVKVEAFLRLSKIPYHVITETNPGRGPKGKMPFIEDGKKRVADSSMILSYLREGFGDTLDAQLTAAQKSVGVSIQRLCEDHLYWILLFARWGDPKGYECTRKHFVPMFPMGMGELILPVIRRRLIAQGRAQGMLRHSLREIYEFGRQDLQAIDELLSHDFLFGSAPSSFDATLFAFLAAIAREPAATDLNNALLNNEKLMQYVDRMHAAAFAENPI